MNDDFMNLLNSQENQNSSQNYSSQPYYPNNPNSQNNSQFECTQNYVEPTQLSPSPSTNNKKTTQRRGENISWREKEDEALMSAWGIISTNAILGKNQKEQIRWGKVWELYELSRTENPNEIGYRTKEALRCRFGKLNEHANKWLACYKEVLNRPHRSGTNDADVEAEAQKLYARDNKGATYGEINVWKNVLCKYRRWSLQQIEVNFNDEAVSYSGGSSKRVRENETDEPNLESGETIPETPPSVNVNEIVRRPGGRDAAKKKLKGKSVCSESSMNPELSTHLSSMQIAREEGNLIMKERLDFERDKIRLETEKELMKSEMMIFNTFLTRHDLSPDDECVKKRLLNKYWPNI